MAVVNKNNIIDVVGSDGAHYVKIYDMNKNVIWEAGGGSDWQLDESSYIIGEDGKYYQKLIDWNKAVDNNPVPDLNNEWVEDTVSGILNIDSNYDYFMSNSNYCVHNSYSQFQVKWKGSTSMTFLYRSYAESFFDYLVINGLDKPKFSSRPSSSTSGILTHTKGKQTTTYNTLTVECDEGEHFIWFCYIKDSSDNFNSNSDRAFVGIPNNLSSYPDGSIKKGSELRYEYIPSGEYINTHDDWYAEKIYKYYYTPDETPINTGEYILGEEFERIPITRDYLSIEILEQNSGTYISVNNLAYFNNLKYIRGNSQEKHFEDEWKVFPTEGKLSDFYKGDICYFKADGMSTSDEKRRFICKRKTSTSEATVEVKLGGDIRSLLGSDFENIDTIPDNAFYSLFSGVKSKTLPKLYAKNVGKQAYRRMFMENYGLTSIGDDFIFNAENLSDAACAEMFLYNDLLTSVRDNLLTGIKELSEDCLYALFIRTGLKSVISLPKATLKPYCFQSMYRYCYSLTELPENYLGYYTTTAQARGCFMSMFHSCYNLVNVPFNLFNINIDMTNNHAICQEMFYNCSSLETAPAIPILEAASSYALQNMFYGCSKLNKVYCYIKSNNGTLLTGNYSLGESWLNGVASTGIFYKNPELPEPEVRGMHTIPAGWEIRDWTTYPEIPDDLIDEGDADGGDADGGDYDGSDDVQL